MYGNSCESCFLLKSTQYQSPNRYFRLSLHKKPDNLVIRQKFLPAEWLVHVWKHKIFASDQFDYGAIRRRISPIILHGRALWPFCRFPRSRCSRLQFMYPKWRHHFLVVSNYVQTMFQPTQTNISINGIGRQGKSPSVSYIYNIYRQ